MKRTVIASIAVLVLVAAGCSTDGTANDAPPEIVALIDDWEAALDLGDGSSVLDLYVAEGYHLYGDQRFEYDQIVNHLSGTEHEWLTDPLLVAEDDDGRFVVVRGLRTTDLVWSNASALLFEIVTTPDDELRIVQTAWFYDSEWWP